MGKDRDIAIIGAGRVGTALGVLAAKAGRKVRAVADVDSGAARSAARRIDPATAAVSVTEAAGAAQLVLLTVPDDAIESACLSLADTGSLQTGAILAHCSGALGSGVLSAAREKCGCAIGSMHPLQTFPNVDAAIEKLPGAHFFCEGDEAATAELMDLAEAIGGKVVRISPQAKTLYHAAAVMACNHLSALLDAAVKMGEPAGLEAGEFLEALAPLVRATVDNVLTMAPEAALSGPIERGDIETIRRHLAAMQNQNTPEKLRAFYRAAGLWTCELARRKGTSPAALEEIEKLLAGA